jgi:hypothetical protein
MRYRSFWILTITLLAAACKPTAPAAETAAVATPTAATSEAAATPTAAAAPTVESAFSKDMPYATLRKRLTGAGWLPLRDPMCRENVGGEAKVCRELPEVESCSGDGHCAMRFANAAEGKRMRVTTYGPSDRWNIAGEEAALAVTSWEVSALDPVAAKDAAPACPSRDFDAFLKAFASDDRIERTFTAPLVKVAELYSDDEGDHTRLVYMTGADYRQFNVDYAGNAYRFVDGEGKVGTSALALDISKESDSTRAVRYRYGMSEGNSYRFEEKRDCWYLTEDPEAPSP